jgi:hypothetical protein
VVAAVEHLAGRTVVDADDVLLARLVSLGHTSGRDTALGVLTFLHGRVDARRRQHHLRLDPAHRPTVRESA